MLGQGMRFLTSSFRSVITLCGDSEGWDDSVVDGGLLIRFIEKLMMALFHYLAADVRLNYGVTQRPLPESVNVWPAMGLNCQS